ncbi:hypothetical protein I8L43_002837 [Listeria monocytogenes]|nr:hypothetical protein [Listeria monocytogenes]EGP9860082.1 hypothetical protein [Listeria monocytogenes]EGR8595333.1 hypothetical protein [Listeria monocytogenes]EGR8601395.1 hypothetical protein [Listeria monocytogenes]EGR8690379.1 hypothetical protein [Listeria monocytogenes]
MNNRKKKRGLATFLVLCAMVLIASLSFPSGASASSAYPKKGYVKSEYAGNIKIEDVYLNRAEAKKLSDKLKKGASKKQEFVGYAATLIPYVGPVLGYMTMENGWNKKEDAKKIDKLLKNKNTKGIHVYDTSAMGRAAATGGSSTQHKITAWDGKRGSIKSGFKVPSSKQKKYLVVRKTKIVN